MQVFLNCIAKSLFIAISHFLQGKDKQRKREQWAVYYTSPQSFKRPFSYSLAKQLFVL